ncbi:MAG: DUF1624 domain-containing protein [Clostridia bacterium]|nr:DUF1624 domain-containing protein [Clostridia bacterium]
MEANKRICLLDEIRGAAVLCMIFYHTFYTLATIFSIPFAYRVLAVFEPIDPYFATIFIVISGIVSQLSRSNLKRGLKLAAVAAAVTLVTYFLVPQDVILFGILHFLAVAMIWFGLTSKWREKIPLAVGLISCAVLTFCFAWVEFGKFAAVIPLPEFLYKTNLLFPFGMYSETFYSADYFPILPWIFVFLFGTYLGRLAKAGKFPAFTYKSRVPFLSFIGKHALWIYVLHQPVIILIAWIITRIVS